VRHRRIAHARALLVKCHRSSREDALEDRFAQRGQLRDANMNARLLERVLRDRPRIDDDAEAAQHR